MGRCHFYCPTAVISPAVQFGIAHCLLSHAQSVKSRANFTPYVCASVYFALTFIRSCL